LITGLEDTSDVGLTAGLDTFIRPAAEFTSSAATGALAGFVAMWRTGAYARRSREQFEDDVLSTPAGLERWAVDLAAACDEASGWLGTLVVETGELELEEFVERFEEWLNLPLWRGRDLLYEIWILCATLRACEAAGWMTALQFVERDSDVWLLSTRPTTSPVAELVLRADPRVTLDVWREPDRSTPTGPLTPDVAVSTPGEHPRDLLVIEAKDRYRMALGPQGRDSALGVAAKYRNGLHPIATWVCNHCDLRGGDLDPARNHGDVWSRIHVAAQFRPRSVPEAFLESVSAALAPPGGHPTGGNRLVLAVDATGSMAGQASAARDTLLALDDRFADYRAVLFVDHWPSDPFVIRDVGPCTGIDELLDRIDEEPSGGGGDYEEALEDAMRRCRELAAELGPITVLVLTDAPPHGAAECPTGIDFAAEVRDLLASGSRCLVADDWQRLEDASWEPFAGIAGFERAPLDALVAGLFAEPINSARVRTR
jgi:hypothetical protein